MAVLPGLRVGLSLDSATFIRETRRVQAELAGMNKSFAVAGTAVKALGAAFGGLIGGLSVSALAQAGKNALDMAGGLKELAQQAGVTTRELQILQFAGTQFGVSSEQISTSLAQFGIRLGKASGEGKGLSDTLKQYSISLTDAQGKTRSSYEVLGDLAEAIQNAGSEQERLTLAAEAFGARVGAKMLPALIQGREGLDAIADTATRVGLILGDDLIAQADRASDAISAMQFAASKGFQVGVVEEFAEAIGNSAEGLIAAREAGEEFGRIVGAVMREAVELAQSLAPALQIVSDTFSGMEQSGQGFTDALRGLGIIDEDLDSINRKLVELEETRREIVATSSKQGELERAVANTTILGIDEQIAALEQEKAELEDVVKQNDALNSSLGMGVKTIDQWTSSLLGSAAAANTAGEEWKDLTETMRFDPEADRRTKQFNSINANSKRVKDEQDAQASISRIRKQASDQAASESKRVADAQKRFNEQQKRDEFDRLSGIAEDFTNRANQQRFDAVQDASREEGRIRERAADASQRQLEREAEAQADLMLEPIRNAAQSIQSTLSDTFVDVFDGGITSAQDFGKALVEIMKRTAADIAAALIMRPIMMGLTNPAAMAGLFGGGAAAAGQGFTTPGGQFIPSVAGAGGLAGFGQGSMFGSFAGGPGGFLGARSGATLGGLGIAGGLGALGGSLIGGQFGGFGGIGGGVGGGLGAVVGTAFGGPLGGLAGGLGGSLAGGFLGSLFGGGGGKQRSATIGGGALGGTGSGLAAQFAAGIDQQLQQALTSSQEALVNAVLRTSKAIKLTFDKEKGLSEGDKQRIAAARLGPAAEALGIGKVGAVTAGTAEQQMAQFQEAVTAKKAIDDLRGSLTPFATQSQKLMEDFSALTDSAEKYGISIEGLDEVHRRAAEQLRREQALTWNAAAAAVGAISPLSRSLADLSIQMQQAQADAEALGISTSGLSLIHQRAAAEITRAYGMQWTAAAAAVGAIRPLDQALADLGLQMQQAAADAQAMGISTDGLAKIHRRAAAAIVHAYGMQWNAAAAAVGAIRTLDQALADLNIQMQQAKDDAEALGISTSGLAQVQQRARALLINQHRLDIHAINELIGNYTPLERGLGDLAVKFENARIEAERLGLSTDNLQRSYEQASAELIRQHQAMNDQQLLAAIDPFERMIDQLKDLGIELDRGLLNPLQQFEAAALHFRDVARRAAGGDLEAIEDFDDAARNFVRTAESVGGSPGRVAAIQEVQGERQALVGVIQTSRAEAERGFERIVNAASDREIDTLKELITEFRILARRLS